MQKTLIYVHDPMCSWCWGFSAVHQQLLERLPKGMAVRRLVGGLAQDSDAPMPEAMQDGLQQTWRRIAQTIPGTEFNFDFWSDCAPRRSTYPACRAVIAAREQGLDYDPLMTRRIQQAYYLEARNPSDNSTLIELAGEIGLDQERFEQQLVAPHTHQQLLDEIASARAIGIDSFPSLALELDGQVQPILISYTDVDAMLSQIDASLR